MKNWLNDISRDINDNIYQRKMKSPSTTLRYKWHQEFIEKGLDKRQSFRSYLKIKIKEWHKIKYDRHTTPNTQMRSNTSR